MSEIERCQRDIDDIRDQLRRDHAKLLEYKRSRYAAAPSSEHCRLVFCLNLPLMLLDVRPLLVDSSRWRSARSDAY